MSNHWRLDCLLNCLFGRRSKKKSKLRVTGLCEGNLPVTGEFPTQRASNAEDVPIWWRHHVFVPGGYDAVYDCIYLLGHHTKAGILFTTALYGTGDKLQCSPKLCCIRISSRCRLISMLTVNGSSSILHHVLPDDEYHYKTVMSYIIIIVIIPVKDVAGLAFQPFDNILT